MDSNDNVIRQVTDNRVITEFTKSEEIEDWEEVNMISANAEKKCQFVTYALVTNSAYTDNSETLISIDKEILYSDGENCFLEESSQETSLSETFYHKIPDSAGTYLVKFADEKSELQNKQNIFATWGAEEYSFVVGIQDDTSLTIIESDKIADLYKNLRMNDWTEISDFPTDNKEVCTINYQPKRKTSNKELVENEIMHLYESDGEYYIYSVIPENSSGNKAMESYYKISPEAERYIEGLK